MSQSRQDCSQRSNPLLLWVHICDRITQKSYFRYSPYRGASGTVLVPKKFLMHTHGMHTVWWLLWWSYTCSGNIPLYWIRLSNNISEHLRKYFPRASRIQNTHLSHLAYSSTELVIGSMQVAKTLLSQQWDHY